MKISTKLILITSLILISVTAVIAVNTSKTFEKRTGPREELINADFAASRATQVEGILTDLIHRTRAAGASLMRTAADPKVISQDFQDGFMRDSNFLAIEVRKFDGSIVDRRVKDQFVKDLCKCDPKVMESAHGDFPIDKVKDGQIAVANTTMQSGPPHAPAMFTVGIPLAKDENGKITYYVLADVDLGLIQKPFSILSERTLYAVDPGGILLAHTEESRVLARQLFTGAEIVSIAASSKLAREQRHLDDPYKRGAHIYASYAKTTYGITVFSELSDQIVLEPAQDLKRQVIFIAGLALSAAFFVVFLFSMTLSAPIERLAELAEAVAKGNFDVKATEIKSKDEVGQLAHAFDHMTEGLKERDKVKSLFTKFHGSSITEDLMSRQTTLDGESKEVLVFFSDIRGFTSFSEKRDPKEVFTMLNEYFHEMVGIVNAQGGVVDKFIGDAIMAVWGAPKATDDDAYNAVMSCLRMRKALNELNERRLARGQTPLLIGMGLHAGPAISGIIGSNERMEYTVIGNTVNTTSRVEAATKTFGTDLLITEEVVQRVGQFFKVSTAGAAEVKGRSDALKLYKVDGYFEKESGNFVEIRTPYSEYPAEEDAKVHASPSPSANEGALPGDNTAVMQMPVEVSTPVVEVAPPVMSVAPAPVADIEPPVQEEVTSVTEIETKGMEEVTSVTTIHTPVLEEMTTVTEIAPAPEVMETAPPVVAAPPVADALPPLKIPAFKIPAVKLPPMPPPPAETPAQEVAAMDLEDKTVITEAPPKKSDPSEAA